MKKLLLTLIAITVAFTPAAVWPQGSAAGEPKAAGPITVKFGAKVKWLYTYQAEDENAKGYGGDGIENFQTTNVEMDLSGSAGDKISFLIEVQAARNNAMWGGASPSEMGPVGIRQAKVVISDLLPMTTVTLGTFSLPVGNYQPRGTHQWDLINLPLINQTRWTGAFNPNFSAPPGQWGIYQPVGLGWQVTGVNFSIAPSEFITVDFAYFNGYASTNNSDIDLEKSWLVNLRFKFSDNANLAFAYLNEGWEEPSRSGKHTMHRTATGWVVSGSYVINKLEANFDFMTMTAPHYMRDRFSDRTDLTWMGYQATVGYWIMDSVELLLRYEWIDPNTHDDSKLDRAAYNSSLGPWNIYTDYDQLTWLTLGVNIRLNECSEVAINYVMRVEQGREIDTDAGQVPNPFAPNGGPKFQELDNDLILIQVQVWQ